MANFCKYCGKALQDGEICTCPQAQAEAAQQYQGQPPQQDPQGYQPQEGPFQGYQPQQPPQGPQGYQPSYQPQPAAPSPVAVGLKKIPDFLKSYIQAPVSAVQSLVNAKDVVVAGALLVVQVIVCGLLLISILSSMVESSGSVVAGLLALVMINVDSSMYFAGDPNLAIGMLMGMLMALIAVAIYVVVIFAAAKISGSQITITDAVVAAGGHSLCVTALLLLSFIAFFIMFDLGAILFAAAMLFWIVLTGPAIQSIASPNATKEGSLWLCTALGVAIVVIVCGWIFSRMIVVPF